MKILKNSLKIKISKYIMFKIFFNDKLAMKFVCRNLKTLEIDIEARFRLSWSLKMQKNKVRK